MSLVTYEYFRIETREVAVCRKHGIAMCTECLAKQLKSMEAKILELELRAKEGRGAGSHE